ncbi:SulA-like leucine-rich domain-containing protein [Alishewanella tabrizica]|uniref:Cell division inhibitor n=1 Tax=Alishewanella tabrizica TaxID=671278 RepID=A0ABQ2WQE6_9ALTE|nr:SulA-like leucine-rich domain-containing protein [Alishewanella tabrizica]GGW68206.1 hypothetical protein GCM10008111_25400 [Alishewanella tabrizica]
MHTIHNVIGANQLAQQAQHNNANMIIAPLNSPLQAMQQAQAELQLLKLVHLHVETPGWILVVAPTIKPSKAFWEACQLPLNKILFIHPKQIKDINTTLSKAVQSLTCTVVINFAPISESECATIMTLAKKQECRFYGLHHTPQAKH